MEKITVEGAALTLKLGLLSLDEDQARRRMHCLNEVDAEKGIYEIVSPVQFKVGEVIGYEPVGGKPEKKSVKKKAAAKK